MRVGFIGIGRMGRGMAANLIKAGHEVTVYNRTAEKAEALAAEGAKIAVKITEACDVDAVFTMLSNDQAVEKVVLSEGGILDSLPQGAIHICSSTISIALSNRLTAAHDIAGQRFLAAPVLGRPDAAAQGRLFVLAAGPEDALRDAVPLSHAIGHRTIYFGSLPSRANIVKLSVDFLIAAAMESLAEATALVVKGGVARHQYFEFLTSTLFDSAAYKEEGKLAVSDDPVVPDYPAAFGLENLRHTIAAGDELNVPLPLVGLLHNRFVELLAISGGAQKDWSEIGRFTMTQAGTRGSKPGSGD